MGGEVKVKETVVVNKAGWRWYDKWWQERRCNDGGGGGRERESMELVEYQIGKALPDQEVTLDMVWWEVKGKALPDQEVALDIVWREVKGKALPDQELFVAEVTLSTPQPSILL
ncbi:hypothetical protein Drorol1_Dr00026708, partial [Drosera rotundifolia]